MIVFKIVAGEEEREDKNGNSIDEESYEFPIQLVQPKESSK